MTRSSIFSLVAVLLASVLPGDLLARAEGLRFRHVSPSRSPVHAILQDRDGFIWIASEDGLRRHDGYGFVVYRNDPEDDTSLGHDSVLALLEDREGNLWIGTDGGGLNRRERASGIFSRFANAPDDPASLSHDRVRVLYQDRKGRIWVGTDGGGLNRLDPETGSFERYLHNPSNPASLGHDRVHAIHEDRDGFLWVGTDGGGLDRLDSDSGTFTHFRHGEGDPRTPSSDRISAISRDARGVLWVGTYDGGLDRLDPATGSFVSMRHAPADPRGLASDEVRVLHPDDEGSLWVGTAAGLQEVHSLVTGLRSFRHDPSDSASLGDDRVTAIYRDRGGVLWVGTERGGLDTANLTTGTFEHERHDPQATSSLTSNMVTSFAIDGGALWIGTFGGGLNRLERGTGSYTSLRHDPLDDGSLPDNRVMSLLRAPDGALWIGTYDAGLVRRDPRTGKLRRFAHDPDDATSLGGRGVLAMHQDANALWVGTYDGGLDRLDLETSRFAHYRHDPSNPTSLGSNRVTCLYEDRRGSFWIGTDGDGLNRLDRVSGTFLRYRLFDDEDEAPGSSRIRSLAEDRDGTLWIGTHGGGLYGWPLSDRELNEPVFLRYDERQGLAGNHVYGIEPDDDGLLWLSTDNGLSRFDPRKNTFRNFDTEDGLQGNEFNLGSHYRSTDGELFFGGSNGFNSFRPEEIRENAHLPPVVLTAVLTGNRPLEVAQPLNELESLEIAPMTRVVSFEFAALDFTAPLENRFAYRLEGFDDEEWIELGTTRRATYTNLAPGRYVLHVRAANNDGIWNETGRSVTINVSPPLWRTWWAYGVYALVMVSAWVAWIRVRRKRSEQTAGYANELESELETQKRELTEARESLNRTTEELERAGVTDALTGLANRRYLQTEVTREIARVERHHRKKEPRTPQGANARPDFTFLRVSIDGLTATQAAHGYEVGDRALLAVRDRLREIVRKKDTLVRWRDDQFLVIGRSLDPDSAEVTAERIRARIESQPFDLGQEESIALTASVGWTHYPFLPHAPTLIGWEHVLAIADRALDVARRRGNSWATVYGTADTPLGDIIRLIAEDPRELARRGAFELRTSADSAERQAQNRS